MQARRKRSNGIKSRSIYNLFDRIQWNKAAQNKRKNRLKGKTKE
nr:hypothetical protein [Mycoplasmopsis bovis]